jgi:prevent-host-death family protein
MRLSHCTVSLSYTDMGGAHVFSADQDKGSRGRNMRTLSVTEARRQWGPLIKAVERGEKVIITLRGKEAAMLERIEKAGQTPAPDRKRR